MLFGGDPRQTLCYSGKMPISASSAIKGWRTPFAALALMAIANSFAFSTWNALHTNYAVDVIGFGGEQQGILHTVREIPGFLAFAAVFLLIFMREQTLGVLSILTIGVGVMLTGFFPTAMGFYVTTVIKSLGFHYYETAAQSLALQWFDKKNAPSRMGKVYSYASMSTIAAYGLIFFTWKWLHLDFIWVFLAGGLVATCIGLLIWLTFPKFEGDTVQRKTLVLRKRYWLYYAITFIGGARRQIFIIFAVLLMVQKFGYTVSEMTMLFLANAVFTTLIAPRMGRFIETWGERRSILIEHAGLFAVFALYAVVSNPWLAAVLYMLDNAFFSMSIAHRTYFQKIGNPEDMAPTAGVAFSINHIAAVFIPIPLGLLWDTDYTAVFWVGSAIAFVGLLVSLLVPRDPAKGNETTLSTLAPEALPAKP
jgi:predicted MFS family arabinose efflux permease